MVSRTLEELDVLRAVDTLEPVTDPYFIPISVRRQHTAGHIASSQTRIPYLIDSVLS